MQMTFWTGTKAATLILLGSVVVIAVGLLRSNDYVTTFATLLGVAGWVAWWYQRVVLARSDPQENPEGESANPDIATTVQDKGVSPTSEPAPKTTAAKNSEPAAASANFGEIAVQIRLARSEAEEAVAATIAGFTSMAATVGEISDCTRELKAWQMDSNPLVKDAVAQLADCSTAISAQIEQMVGTLQFQDRLSQRLEYAADALDPTAKKRHQAAPTHGPVLQNSAKGSKTSIGQNTTIF